MSLQVWLPLNGDLHNQGLADVSVTNADAVVNASGKIGQCYSFGTSKSYLVVDHTPLKTFTEFSFACWVKILSWNTNYATIFAAKNGTGVSWNNLIFSLLRNGSNQTLCFNISNGSSYTSTSCKTGALSLDTWYYIVCTYKAGIIKLYVDGVEVSSYNTSVVPNFSSIANLWIGRSNDGSYQSHTLLNDIRIYDECLDPLEIKRLSQGLVLHYPLNNNGLGNENLALNTRHLDINAAKTNKYCSKRVAAQTLIERNDGFVELNCTASWQGMSIWANTFNFAVGDKITYSFMIYGNGSTRAFSFYPMMYNSAGTRDTTTGLPISIDGGTYTTVNAKSFTACNNTAPERHYVTFEWNQAVKDIIDNGGSIELTIQVHGTWNTGDWVRLYAPKLERGEKPSAYSPSPYEFNDSNIEYDVSGYDHDGTRVGTFNWSNDTPRYNVSTQFNSTQIKRDSLNGEVKTLACWVKTTANKSTSQFVVADYNSNLCISFYSGCIIGVFGSTRSTGSKSTLGSSYKENDWNHIVVVKTGDTGERAIYCNGILLTPTTNDYWSNAAGFLISGRNTSNTLPMRGYISDVRAYATALSPDDIKALYEDSAYIATDGTAYAYEFVEE